MCVDPAMRRYPEIGKRLRANLCCALFFKALGTHHLSILTFGVCAIDAHEHRAFGRCRGSSAQSRSGFGGHLRVGALCTLREGKVGLCTRLCFSIQNRVVLLCHH